MRRLGSQVATQAGSGRQTDKQLDRQECTFHAADRVPILPKSTMRRMGSQVATQAGSGRQTDKQLDRQECTFHAADRVPILPKSTMRRMGSQVATQAGSGRQTEADAQPDRQKRNAHVHGCRKSTHLSSYQNPA